MAELCVTQLSGSTTVELLVRQLAGGITPFVAPELQVTHLSGGVIPKPLADAGADKTAEPLAVIALDGTGSRYTTAYSWAQVAGAAVTIQNASSATASFIAPAGLATGQLTFRLTVDGGGIDDVVVTVYPQLEWYYDGADWRAQRFTDV